MSLFYKNIFFYTCIPFLCIFGTLRYQGYLQFPQNQPILGNTSSKSEIFFSEKVRSAEKIIQKEYYHFSEKSKEEIEDGVIASLVNSLGDKHSSYFNPKEAKEFSNLLRGDFDGIGAVIDDHPQGIIIRKIFEDSPAKKAGLLAGDIITKVGEESMLGMKSDEAVKKIRGPKGSKVIITYTRGDEKTASKIEITRDTIIIPSTREAMFTGSLSHVGYLEVAFFGEKTPEEFQKAFQNLTSSGAEAIILDFRNNGGGYLDAAVDMLSLLLPDDTLAVTTKENDIKKTQPLSTRANNFTNERIPLIMLINDLSASATEIVAGALQDYGRAVIVGEKSYGKGSVQEPFVLSDGSILKITIGRWYTPKNQVIDKNGITPDITIPLLNKDFENQYDRQLENAKIITLKLLSPDMTREKLIQEMKNTDFTKTPTP